MLRQRALYVFIVAAFFIFLGAGSLQFNNVRAQNSYSVTRISVASDETQSNHDSTGPHMSGDLVLFTSSASNLIPDDTNNTLDVFIKKTESGSIERVSVTSNEGQIGSSGKWNNEGYLSESGNCTLFTATASGVAIDTNFVSDVYLRDFTSQTTELISVDKNGQAADKQSFLGTVSADCRYVVFLSMATDLVTASTDPAYAHMFLRDRTAGSTYLLVTNLYTNSNPNKRQPRISGDGRYILFHSSQAQVPADTNNELDVYIYGRETGIVELASGVTVGNGSATLNGVISNDGRFVVWDSRSTNYTNDKTTVYSDVFFRDRQTEVIEKISKGINGTEPIDTVHHQPSSYPRDVTNDGRYILFDSIATNLVENGATGCSQVYRYDRQTGTTKLISVGQNGEIGSCAESVLHYEGSYGGGISEDGDTVTYFSYANNLVTGDTNGYGDIFLFEGGLPDPTPTHTATNTATPTPTYTPPAPVPTPVPSTTATPTTIPTATPIAGSKEVIVLVHGWLGLEKDQVRCSDGITIYDAQSAERIILDWKPLADKLVNDGFEVWMTHLNSGPEFSASIDTNAVCLSNQLESIKDRLPADDKFIIIAHSMGGLVTRAYVENPNLYEDRNDVKTLITLGSPHGGVPLEGLEYAMGLMGAKRNQQYAVTEMLKSNIGEGVNKKYKDRASDVSYSLSIGVLSHNDARGQGRLMQDVYAIVGKKGSNDGLVFLEDGLKLANISQKLQTSEGHGTKWGPHWYFGANAGKTMQSYTSCIKPALTGDVCVNTTSSAQIYAAEESSINAMMPVQNGMLSENAPLSFPVFLDKQGNASFTAIWDTGVISFTLTGPDDTIVDTNYVVTHPNEASHYLDESMATYTLNSAMPGIWMVSLASSTATAYRFSAFMESSITLSAGVDKTIALPGETIQISAQLTGTTSAVNARLSLPDDTEIAIPLNLQDNGSYEGSYPIPSGITGQVLVSVYSSAPPREALTGFLVASNNISFNGNITDSGMDMDANGKFESVQVTIPIKRSSAGNYTLVFSLNSGTTEIFRQVRELNFPASGATNEVFEILAADIIAAGIRGSFIADISLLENGDLILPAVNSSYTTKQYELSQFEGYSAQGSTIYLPIVIK